MSNPDIVSGLRVAYLNNNLKPSSLLLLKLVRQNRKISRANQAKIHILRYPLDIKNILNKKEKIDNIISLKEIEKNPHLILRTN